MKRTSGPIAWLQYVLIRTALTLVQVLPLESSLRTARALARGWVRIMPRHRERAIRHLTDALAGSIPPGRIERIADRCLAHWTRFVVDVACAPRLITASTWPRYVRVKNVTETLDLMLSGRGAIMVTGHYGYFELAGHILACLGFDVTAVMRPVDNVYLNRYVVASRRAHGLRLLDKKGAMTEAERVLADGSVLCFIADQDAGRKGLFVDFFGKPASTYKSIGLLAMATESPVVVGYARRIGRGFLHEVGIQRVIHPHEWQDRDDPLRWITQTYTRAIEDFIRDEPEQYLWIHRRWKSQPKQRARKAIEPVVPSIAAAGGAAER